MDMAAKAVGRVGELRLGDVVFRPAERKLAGPRAVAALEPRVVQVLGALAAEAGAPVARRALFELCWGHQAAGDDSLNRAIYQLRKALAEAGSREVTVETLAASGYVLYVAAGDHRELCERARRSWRAGLPFGDEDTIGELRAAAVRPGQDAAEVYGLLALLLSRAVEYAPIEACAELVRSCEEAAARALELDPRQPDARVALSSLGPLFGDWIGARERLLDIVADAPAHFPARHELAVLEMSTGRVEAAVPMIAALIEEDPLAATLHYKRGYHLYCLGDQDAMDRVLDRGLQLWPRHPALWQARSLTFAFTGRAHAALMLLEDNALRPPMPAPTLEFHRTALSALVDGGPAATAAAIAALSDAARWQSLAATAVMYLCALGGVDQAMDVCERYYLRDGDTPVRLRYEPGVEASINEMHRRATQPLFLPVTDPLRAHPRFSALCERMGLAEYWREAGVAPDHRQK